MLILIRRCHFSTCQLSEVLGITVVSEAGAATLSSKLFECDDRRISVGELDVGLLLGSG